MAEVLGKAGVVAPCGHASLGFLGSKRSGFGVSCPPNSLEIGDLNKSGFLGGNLVLRSKRTKPMSAYLASSPVQTFLSKAMKWWDKGLQPNMREIESAQDLVDSLLNAGDKLVIVDFFSPGCGGCRALHPKICQLAEMSPDVMFLQVNYEQHKSMCYSLHVHVLPFFRFYRGAQGKLCSFSCTNATIKKFKDALAKHTPDRCSLGPTRGLEESELLALAANKDLQFTYTKTPELVPSSDDVAEEVITPQSPRLPLPSAALFVKESEEKALVASGR